MSIFVRDLFITIFSFLSRICLTYNMQVWRHQCTHIIVHKSKNNSIFHNFIASNINYLKKKGVELHKIINNSVQTDGRFHYITDSLTHLYLK